MTPHEQRTAKDSRRLTQWPGAGIVFGLRVESLGSVKGLGRLGVEASRGSGCMGLGF